MMKSENTVPSYQKHLQNWPKSYSAGGTFNILRATFCMKDKWSTQQQQVLKDFPTGVKVCGFAM